MWSISNLKNRGKTAFRRNYWKCVLVGVIISIIGGGLGAASSVGSGGDIEKAISGTNDDASFRMDGNTFYYDFYDGGDRLAGDFNLANPFAIAAIVAAVGVVVLVVFAIVLVLDILIINPLEMGADRFFFINQQKNADVKEICYGFDRNYKNIIKILFFRDLYTFLWSLLFIIPGIVKAYEYRMISYIIAENPDISMEEAFARSRYMMDGEKWHAFCLDLSFIGWWILTGLTGGIVGVFYAIPYEMSTNATLYEALKYLKLENRRTSGDARPNEPVAAQEAPREVERVEGTVEEWKL